MATTVDRALALLTGDEPQHTQPPSAKTIEKAVAWEIEDEIAAKTGRARFGPLQALAGDLDALEEAIKEGDGWLEKNVDDLDGVDAAVRDVSDDAKANEEDFVAKCVEETTALRECMMKDPGYYGEMDDEGGGNDDDDDDDDDEKSKRSENNKSRSESSRKDRSSEKEQKR